MALHERGLAHVAVVGMSASESQRAQSYLDNFEPFDDRLARLGIANVPTLAPTATWNVTFFDRSLWGGAESLDRETAIHGILFPDEPLTWDDYRSNRSEAKDEKDLYKVWRNHRCDVDALCSHIRENRDVFVTRDKNFHKETKRPKLVLLGAGEILDPADVRDFVKSRKMKVNE